MEELRANVAISIDKIVSQIVELSLEKRTGSESRDIYSVLIDVSLEIGEVMRLILEQERNLQRTQLSQNP